VSLSVNMFVGIKKTGTFQHSSLLSGGVVTSAGLISVKGKRSDGESSGSFF
jgi:hypothetical protein